MKIFRTKVFKILDCLIHGRGMLRVNWDREYGPSDIYSDIHILWIEWGKAWWLKFYLLHGVYNLFEKQCGCTKNITMNPHSCQMSDSSKSRQSHTCVFTYPGQYLHILYIILYMICTNLPFHSIPQESILKPNSVQMLMAYCKKLIASAYIHNKAKGQG